MISKKIFKIEDCAFNLPDNFNGTLGDALMLLAKYRLEQEKMKNVNNIEMTDTMPNCYEELIKKDDIKCSITYGIYELSKDNTYKPLVINTARKEKQNVSSSNSL